MACYGPLAELAREARPDSPNKVALNWHFGKANCSCKHVDTAFLRDELMYYIIILERNGS